MAFLPRRKCHVFEECQRCSAPQESTLDPLEEAHLRLL